MRLIICYGSAIVLLVWAALLEVTGRRLSVTMSGIMLALLGVTLALNLRNSYRKRRDDDESC